MKIFLKGFCIGLFCLSLLGLLWFLVLQPGLTNGEAQALKTEYAQPLPGAESSGVLPAGKEQLEPESLVGLPALQAEYPDIKGWISMHYRKEPFVGNVVLCIVEPCGSNGTERRKMYGDA